MPRENSYQSELLIRKIHLHGGANICLPSICSYLPVNPLHPLRSPRPLSTSLLSQDDCKSRVFGALFCTKFAFSINLPYVTLLIIRPAKEPRREEENSFLPYSGFLPKGKVLKGAIGKNHFTEKKKHYQQTLPQADTQASGQQ